MFGLSKKKNDEEAGVPARVDDLETELAEIDAVDEEPKGSSVDGEKDPIKIYTVISAIIVVGLGGWILYTARLVNRYESELASAKDSYSEIYELGRALEENLEKMGPDRDKGLEVKTGFFYEKANESGIQNRAIKRVEPRRSRGRGFSENSWTVSFNEPLDRQQIANFLYNVEASHPVLKATEVTVSSPGKFDDKSDLWNAVFKFAFRVPQR